MTSLYDDFRIPNHSRMIGSSNILERLSKIAENSTNFPPYNLVQTSKDQYVIEVAVAGYDPNNISVLYENDVLTVKTKDYGISKIESTDAPDVPEFPKVLHRGISKRRFQIKWVLTEYLVVDSVEYKDGIINIRINYILPESKKAKEFPLLTA